MAYTDRRSEYGASLSSSGSVGRLGSGPDHHDSLSIHQALQNAVDDQEQNQVCDETATTFMTDLPLLKSKFLLLFVAPNQVLIESGHLRMQGSCFDGIISSDLGVSRCISLLLCL